MSRWHCWKHGPRSKPYRHRLFGSPKTASLGWLFIDEAGQALPQAAAGAVMRARRTIVVGDQLQIPPVISLPVRLVQEICDFFQVDHADWSAPKSSAQTLADSASRFQSVFDSDQGPRRVGIPLLVHRRCQEPMFSISNKIAYNGLMVHAAGARDPGLIGDLLGVAQWFNLDGEARSKWCEAEGEWVVRLLRQVSAAQVPRPDIAGQPTHQILSTSPYRAPNKTFMWLGRMALGPEQAIAARWLEAW